MSKCAAIMHELTFEEIRPRVTALCDDGRRRIIGLVGAPGAGKSTLAAEIAGVLPGAAAIVPMDGFHLAGVELARLGRSGRKGAHDTFDAAGYVALLRRIRDRRADEIVYAPEFRRELEEPVAGAIAVLPEHRLIVTEGNYLLLDIDPWAAVRGLIDEIWFVDIDPGVRLARLIARHERFGRSPEAARAWVETTDEPNARLIEATRPRADAVFRLAADVG